MADATLRFPSNITEQGTYLVLTRYESQGFNTNELRNIDEIAFRTKAVGAYGLPVPNNLQDSSSINYLDIQDTNVLGAVENVASSKASDFAANQTKLATGATLSNIPAMLFNSVNVKSFTFNWTLIPESSAEATSITDIIKGLDEAKLPYFTSFVGTDKLKFPDIFKISFGGVQPKLISYLPSVITGLEVTYSNGHFQIYNDGHFPSIELSVTFSELVGRTREMQKRLQK